MRYKIKYDTILCGYADTELWKYGGVLGSDVKGFVPHFIAREVKKRNEWIQSKDIQVRQFKPQLVK